jgi:hypothetical protein
MSPTPGKEENDSRILQDGNNGMSEHKAVPSGDGRAFRHRHSFFEFGKKQRRTHIGSRRPMFAAYDMTESLRRRQLPVR